MGRTRCAVRGDALDGQPLTVLDAADGRCQVRVAHHGAALVSFRIQRNESWHELAGGYRTGKEIAARPGSRFAIMAPFAGRIADARYTFDGKTQDLAPGAVGAARQSRHGFVRDADFHVAASSADDTRASVTLTTAIRPQLGYPWSIDLAVRFTLDAAGLTLAATLRNVGAAPAPCFFGWHAYWRVGEHGLDPWQLGVPAQTLIRTGADLIALPGAAAYVPLESVPQLDFRQPRAVGTTVLDHGYAGLRPDADGRLRTHLGNPATGLALAVWQERGVMHVFTGDSLPRDRRDAIALEPMECMADAFNRPECADAIRLEAGAERVFRCGVEVEDAR
ncbi:MAG TPA: aldose epimerase [Rhodanobacteraceae bacterium]